MLASEIEVEYVNNDLVDSKPCLIGDRTVLPSPHNATCPPLTNNISQSALNEELKVN